MTRELRDQEWIVLSKPGQGDVEAIIVRLNRAAAAELHDAFRYKLLAALAAGHHSAEFAEVSDEDDLEGFLADLPSTREGETFIPFRHPHPEASSRP